VTRWRSTPIFSLFLVGVAGFFVIQTLSLNPLARLVPLLVAFPTLWFVAVQLRIDLRTGGKNFGRENALLRSSEEYREKVLVARGALDMGISRKRELLAIIWMFAMFFLTYLFGLLLASPLYTFLYLKIRGRKPWVQSVAIAGAVAALSYLLLILLSDGLMYTGKVWSWSQ
jgi:hypothetical protein